jgi:hypothetical protein
MTPPIAGPKLRADVNDEELRAARLVDLDGHFRRPYLT